MGNVCRAGHCCADKSNDRSSQLQHASDGSAAAAAHSDAAGNGGTGDDLHARHGRVQLQQGAAAERDRRTANNAYNARSDSASASASSSSGGGGSGAGAALEEGLRNMANGGHQMLAGLSVPLKLTRRPGAEYYHFAWPPCGSVEVTSFGIKIVASEQGVEFVEGLANYATFTCEWERCSDPQASDDSASPPLTGPGTVSAAAAAESVSTTGSTMPSGRASSGSSPPDAHPATHRECLKVTLHSYKSVDANSGETIPVKACAKKFLVEINSPHTASSAGSQSVNDGIGTASFLSVLNVDELVGEAIELAVSAAQAQAPTKRPQDLAELKALLVSQRDVMEKGVVDDIQLMWKRYRACTTSALSRRGACLLCSCSSHGSVCTHDLMVSLISRFFSVMCFTSICPRVGRLYLLTRTACCCCCCALCA
jgi:hypothetical protein